MIVVIHPTYFPNVAHFVAMLKANHVYFETADNYQKQTFRNRTEIYGANGKLTLTLPVSYSQKHRQLYKDVQISNNEDWQQLHLKSLESAYRMSPFFEFYIDELMPLFKKRFEYILDFNLECFAVLLDCLQLEIPTFKTATFEKQPNFKADYRPLVNKNFDVGKFEYYTQVFTEKHGFINNLSILDLLFNEGPNSESYLRQQTLPKLLS